jgi:hypothetical protein
MTNHEMEHLEKLVTTLTRFVCCEYRPDLVLYSLGEIFARVVTSDEADQLRMAEYADQLRDMADSMDGLRFQVERATDRKSDRLVQ